MQARRASPALAAAPWGAGHAVGGRGEKGLGDVSWAVAQANALRWLPHRAELGYKRSIPPGTGDQRWRWMGTDTTPFDDK